MAVKIRKTRAQRAAAREQQVLNFYNSICKPSSYVKQAVGTWKEAE